jgi:hypothetical protein
MKFHFRLPGLASSSVQTPTQSGQFPILDGRDVRVANRWSLPAHSVAIIGRPAVSFSLGIGSVHWEADFGGHLFVAITDDDAANVTILEGGPTHPNGTGALVPFCYPEVAFAEKGIIDFDPIVIQPPHGLDEGQFAALVRSTQNAYDGDQLYVAINLPFLVNGRDSNSYAAAVLLCSGVDVRAIPKPTHVMRREISGYPGLADPVHPSNFGVYFGPPTRLNDHAVDVAFHNADGSVRYVVVGGDPHSDVVLPDGETVTLDNLGRMVFAADDARVHGLPSAQADPPDTIRERRRFPSDPQPAGGFVTFVRDSKAAALKPGDKYRGRVTDRHDALGFATIATADGELVLPLAELGVEMRDPKRVDALVRVGNELTLGLQRDRHPRLVAHGALYFADRLQWRRFHAPRGRNIAVTILAVGLTFGLVLMVRRRLR